MARAVKEKLIYVWFRYNFDTMAPVWTAERMILLENAISERGYAWTLFATDPAFGLTAFSAPALRNKWSSMAEVGEWSDDADSDSSLDKEEYVNYSGLLGDISSSDDSDYLPPENPEVDEYDSDLFNEDDDVDYQPHIADAEIPIAVQARYNLRERLNGVAVHVPPRSLQELRTAQVPCSWNEDIMQQFSKAIGSRGCNWTAISNDPTIGLPENLTADAMKMKYRSLDERVFWRFGEDSSSEDDDPVELVEYIDYAKYVLGPILLKDNMDRLRQPRPRRGPVAAVAPQVDVEAAVPPQVVEEEEMAGALLQLEEAAVHHPPPPQNPFPHVPKRPRTARFPPPPPNA